MKSIRWGTPFISFTATHREALAQFSNLA
jgi:hypothetical protein